MPNPESAFSDPMRILVVDDHPVFRKGVIDLLAARWPLCRFAECGSAAAAETELGACPWDLVVLDQFLPDAFGIELLGGQWLPRTLLLTMQRDPGLMEQVRAKGAGGYLCKSEPPERIVEAAVAIVGGRRWFPPRADGPVATLSDRERAVLVALLAGEGPQAISRSLGLSRSSVQSYKDRLFEKLQVTSLPELGRKASLYGLG